MPKRERKNQGYKFAGRIGGRGEKSESLKVVWRLKLLEGQLFDVESHDLARGL